MPDPYDDTPDAAPAQPAFAPTVVEPQVTDVARAEGYLRQHAARAKSYGVNYDDIMKQRQAAVSQVQSTLNDTIQEMRDKHEGKGAGQINLPLAALAAGMLSGTGPGAGNFGAQVGRGLGNMTGVIQKQRMQDSEFLKGVAELQAKSGELGDAPLKDAATLARMQQLQEMKGADALEKGIVTAKLDQPKSLGRDAMGNAIIWDPKANAGAGAIVGAGGKPVDLDHNKVGLDANGQQLQGDDFIKAVAAKDPTLASAVKGYADYENPIPQGSRSPAMTAYNQYLFALAKRANPDFDITNYGAIQKGKKDWTGNGTMAQRAVSAATIPGHLADLQGSAAALANSGLLAGNKIGNLIATQSGDPRVAAFNAARQAVMTELPSFLGKGHPAEGQIMAWLNVVNDASSPEQLQASIKGLSKVMHTQLETLSEAKGRDFGKPGKFSPDDLIGKDNASAMADIVNNDISTPGGAMSAMRRSQNHELTIGRKPTLPNPPPSVWEKNSAILKKSPTPQNRAYFDDTFGAGSSKMVLGK